MELTLTGDLIVRTAQGHFTESRPVAFQSIEGTRRKVECSFELISASEYRIALDAYDERHELVIDPVLDWSTFLGGNHVERLRNVGVDSSGNIVVAGDTYSTDFPGAEAFPPGPGLKYDSHLDRWHEDVAVAKLSPDGAHLLWAAYLSGAGLTGDTTGPRGLALNTAGDVYLTGYTDSPDFPTTTGASHAGLSDAYIAKNKGDGSVLLWSVLLGGADEDWGTALALDSQENVYVAGLTRSGGFPVLNAFDSTLGGGQDVFLARFDANGAMQWYSYLGGNEGEERAAALVVEAGGSLFLLGDTESADFPANIGDTTLGGASDAFVSKLAGDGTGILWSRFLGGSGDENEPPPTPGAPLNGLTRLRYPRGDIALDSAGNIIVAGHTYSSDLPTTVGVFDTSLAGPVDGYLAKIAPNGTSLLWASYLGGSASGSTGDRVMGVAVNPWDEIFITGRTDSPDFPATPGALQTTFQGGGEDGFLTTLSASGSLLYSSFLGGSQSTDTGLGIAYNSGNVFVTGWALAGNFPTTAGAFQPGCGSCAPDVNGSISSDGFVAKFLDAFIAHDGFESGNYSGGTGWTGAWTGSGDISILTSSGPHSGTRHVRLRRATALFRRTFAVPPAATAIKLGFWAKVHSFEASDHADVLVSADGGSASTVATFTSAQSDNQYRYHELALTSFLPASQLQVTFDAGMSDTGDNWYLDDIRVTGTSGPVPPVADAGADQTVSDADDDGREPVTLDGSASFDPDGGTIVGYGWTEDAAVLGTEAIISTDLVVGPHTLTLTVTDDEGVTSSDTALPAAKPPESLCPATTPMSPMALRDYR